MGGNTEATMFLILGIFAVAHSGLAGLRSRAEPIIGARAYRVLFGLVSLPGAGLSFGPSGPGGASGPIGHRLLHQPPLRWGGALERARGPWCVAHAFL